MFKRMKSIAAVGILGSVLLLSACGTSGDSTSEEPKTSGGAKTEAKTYKVGISQFVAHPSLDNATAGFKRALEEAGLQVEYDEQNAQADQNNVQTIATNFVGDNVDLIFANATPSALGALNATKDIPIIFTSVTDPIGAGLVKSVDEPGENITGTIDNHPDAIPNTVKFIQEQMGAKTIGVVFNSGEPNSVAQIEMVKAAIDGTNLKLAEATVATSAEVKQAAESLIGKADCLYIITDNTVVSALESVIQVANDHDIPLFVGELDSVARGGFAAYGFDYGDIGFEAGQMAAQVLKGEKTTAEIPVQYPQNLKLVINKKAAAEMNIELKEEWNEIAEFIAD